ncbi:MAG: hypothetical protein KDI46_04470 [Alphaproteobacteria bacterium]|nr:hypothetical protein [Alphaproteobacteria bacterium]
MKPSFTPYAKRASEAGSALVYILIAIALLAALTLSFMDNSSQQTSSQNSFKSVAGLQGQVNIIRSAIQECILKYPGGDSTIDTSGGGSDPSADDRYPIKPSSTHYDGPPAAVIGKTAGRLVKDIRCPGHQDGANVTDHAKIFSGKSGKFLPPPPDLFEDWQYYNGQDGIYFWTRTTKSDSFLASALSKLDAEFSACETDVIDASGGAVNLDDAGTAETTCPAGNLCFRVWVLTKSPAGQHQDTADGCDS